MEADTALTAAGSRTSGRSFPLDPEGVTVMSENFSFSAPEDGRRPSHVNYFNMSTSSATFRPWVEAERSSSITRTCLEVRAAPDWTTLTEDGGARHSSPEVTINHQELFCQSKAHGMTVDAEEPSLWSTGTETTQSCDNVIEEEDLLDSHCGAKMHEGDQDNGDYEDLPEFCMDLLRDDNELMRCLTTELFSDSLLNGEEFLNDASVSTELQRQENKIRDRKLNGRKRQRGASQSLTQVENTPCWTKRFKATVGESESGPQPPGSSPIPAAPARILQFPPSFHLITIPDQPGCAVVQTVKLSPPVVQLPVQNTAAPHTYILVPSSSPPSKHQLQPLSPVGGAVAPVQMSSSPPGSLSDTASRAMSPRQRFSPRPIIETSPCKDSSCPQSPPVLEVQQVVKDYIREVKDHVNRACLCIEEGLSLTSHYVDVQVSQRELLCSGKNTNKELRIMGDKDQQKTLLDRSQILKDIHGHKKRYILLIGNAGMGKTTLIKKLCLDWSTDCIPQFDFVFVLDKKTLFLTKPTYSLQTLLLNLSSFVPPCLDPDAVYARIVAASKRVLLIFDGFEELRDYENLIQMQNKDLTMSLQKDSKAEMFTVRQLYSAILQRTLLPGSTLLLTSRPRGAASQLLRRVNSILEVCGFSTSDVETYLSRYFTDPDLQASALDFLKKSSYLHLLCWNPGLCRLVCMVLENLQTLDAPPRTLTELCHQVLCLKMEKMKTQTQTSLPSVKGNKSLGDIQTKVPPDTYCQRRTKRTRNKKTKERNDMDQEELRSVGQEIWGVEERNLMDQLSFLAWETVKANSSVLPAGHTLSAKLKDFGLRTKLLGSHPLGKDSVKRKEGEGDDVSLPPPLWQDIKEGNNSQNRKAIRRGRNAENVNPSDDCVLFWTNPFLQSYLAGVHLSLSRNMSERHFLQALPPLSGPKGRRRHQSEEQVLTQRFAVSLLFHNRTLQQRLLSFTKTPFNTIVSRQALVVKQLQGLSYGDLSPVQVLEVCHCLHEASTTCGEGSRSSSGAKLVSHVVENLPAVLSFSGIPLRPPDVFTVKYILDKGGEPSQGPGFHLDLEDTGIQVSGMRSLIVLDNVRTYRACVADVIALWEQLEESGEEELLQQAVSRLELNPLKITQVCHVEHLAKLVDIHVNKRLSDSCSQTDSILAEGVPAIRELRKLEFELGPDRGPLGLPRLWELLPGLMNLHHLDLENNKIGDRGLEMLANTLVTLPSLEILNLSQNCIGDQGVKKLAPALTSLPKLYSLSIYSNMISDEGAEKLAAVLPHMASLTDLDVKYNKMTDVGALSLGASLRNCHHIKTLRMWNDCIPYGVFERLQQQDSRILLH